MVAFGIKLSSFPSRTLVSNRKRVGGREKEFRTKRQSSKVPNGSCAHLVNSFSLFKSANFGPQTFTISSFCFIPFLHLLLQCPFLFCLRNFGFLQWFFQNQHLLFWTFFKSPGPCCLLILVSFLCTSCLLMSVYCVRLCVRVCVEFSVPLSLHSFFGILHVTKAKKLKTFVSVLFIPFWSFLVTLVCVLSHSLQALSSNAYLLSLSLSLLFLVAKFKLYFCKFKTQKTSSPAFMLPNSRCLI